MGGGLRPAAVGGADGEDAAASGEGGKRCPFEVVQVKAAVLVAPAEQGGSPGAAGSADPWSAAAKGVDIRSLTGEACPAVRLPALSVGSACTASTAANQWPSVFWQEGQ